LENPLPSARGLVKQVFRLNQEGTHVKTNSKLSSLTASLILATSLFSAPIMNVAQADVCSKVDCSWASDTLLSLIGMLGNDSTFVQISGVSLITTSGLPLLTTAGITKLITGADKEEVIQRAAPAAGEFLADHSIMPEDLQAAFTVLLAQKGQDEGQSSVADQIKTGAITLDTLATEIVLQTQ